MPDDVPRITHCHHCGQPAEVIKTYTVRDELGAELECWQTRCLQDHLYIGPEYHTGYVIRLWSNVEAIGGYDQAMCQFNMVRGRTAEVELAGDVLPPHTYELHGMWFVTVLLTDFYDAADSNSAHADQPIVSQTFVGVIAGTTTVVELNFLGERLNYFRVALTPPQPREEI